MIGLGVGTMEEEISLKDMFQILKRRFTIILATFLLITILGGAFSFLLNKQEYSSTTSLLVGEEKEVIVEPKDPEEEDSEPVYETTIVYGDTIISKQASSLYNEIIARRDLLEDVINSLNLNISVGQLKNSITMEIPPDSGIIEITVTGITMSNADEIVNEIAKGFMELVFEITEVENIRVMNTANRPIVSNTQNIKLNIAISAVLGIMIGIFLAFIMEYLDDRIRTIDNVEERLKLEVIGEVPNAPHASEALRTIRTNIQFSSKFKDKKTLVITSPVLDNDNTKLSSDLSNIIAEGNKKVLLIDSDLRNPSLHEKLKISNDKGLSNVLLGNADLEESLNAFQENKNLHILTSGPAQEKPAELLSGDEMKGFLSIVKDKYDYIILNSHPIGEITDSIALSALADRVILVLSSGVTREKDVEVAKKALEKVGANIVGALLNQA